jgi:hypothetical protein
MAIWVVQHQALPLGQAALFAVDLELVPAQLILEEEGQLL